MTAGSTWIRRGRARRGTTRNPGPDLHRLPTGLDLSGVSIAEGVRAALASAVFLVLNQWIHSTPLTIASTGAMITCFCDTGGTLRQRLPMLLSFTILGGCTWATFGLLRAGGIALVLPCAAAAVFLFSMARVWGLRSQTVGNILIVVLALAIDRPLTGPAAALFLASFIVGGLWACLLTLVIWRIQPDRPALRAVGAVWTTLADLAAEMRALAGDPATAPALWEAHARSHRRAVRVSIETARGVVSTSVRSRGLVSGRGTRAALMLEIADQLFGEMIILSELLETMQDERERQATVRMLRRLQRLLRVIATDAPGDLSRIGTSLDRMQPVGEATPTGDLTRIIVDRLRVALRVLDNPDQVSLQTVMPSQTDRSWRERFWEPLRGELTWTSAILRHAVRATILTVPAIAVSLLWWTPYSHWLTITVALTMQPFFAATWQRALERIGGTVLGALIGGALAFLPQTPLVLGAALLPLSIIGFSVRQVSYGAYIACLTPLIVLLFDLVEPGHSALAVAGMRTLYTLVGGVIAIGACMVLWPSWEPRRLQNEFAATLRAYAGLSSAILKDPVLERAADTEAARRAAGLANNNFEASLSRALQEPVRNHPAELLKIVAADAILRRLGASLLAVPHDAALRDLLAGPDRQRWETYLERAFSALAAGQPVPAEAPDAPAASTLSRIRRGLDTLSADLAGTDAAAVPA